MEAFSIIGLATIFTAVFGYIIWTIVSILDNHSKLSRRMDDLEVRITSRRRNLNKEKK